MIVQLLLPGDFAQRRQCCEAMLDIVDEDAMSMMSDESHFLLDGRVSKQNYRYWVQENRQQLHKKPLYSSKVTVWCGIVGHYVFFKRIIPQFVTSACYIKMLDSS
jgi:hypothetical protein